MTDLAVVRSASAQAKKGIVIFTIFTGPMRQHQEPVSAALETNHGSNLRSRMIVVAKLLLTTAVDAQIVFL